MPEVKAFAPHLTAILARREWIAADLAKAADLAEPVIARILSGERKPDLNTLIRLARGLEMTIDELLGLSAPVGKVPPSTTLVREITEERRISKRTT